MRSPSAYFKAALRKEHWKNLARIPMVYKHPIRDGLLRYVLGWGSYPATISVASPTGVISVRVANPVDLFTINEVFNFECYRAGHSMETFVDFGANIGVASVYFLTRNSFSSGFAFEPLEANYKLAAANLSAFGERITLKRLAVADREGTIALGVEPTGRYSGLDGRGARIEQFRCIGANDALEDALGKLGRIDVLKIDVEGSERLIIPALAPEILKRIDAIYVEAQVRDWENLSAAGFKRTLSMTFFEGTGGIARFSR